MGIFLFRQPFVDLRQYLFFHVFRHVADTGAVATSGLDVDLFVYLAFESRDAGGAPRVHFAIDKNHLRVVVTKEIIDFVVEFGAVFYFVDQFFRQHDAVQVSFAAVDCQVFPERFRVITVVAQFAGSLYEERYVRLVFGKIVGPLMSAKW